MREVNLLKLSLIFLFKREHYNNLLFKIGAIIISILYGLFSNNKCTRGKLHVHRVAFINGTTFSGCFNHSKLGYINLIVYQSLTLLLIIS